MTNQEQKEMLEKEYEKMIHARDFHYDNFNKWSAYFCVFIGALFVAYYNVARDDVYLKLSIAILGYIVSYLSYLSCRGYYFWWLHWNLLIDNFEKTHQGDIPRVYSVFADKKRLQVFDKILNGLNISTAKITMLMLLILTLAWGVLIAYICRTWMCFWLGLCIMLLVSILFYYFAGKTQILQSNMIQKKNLSLLKKKEKSKLSVYTSIDEKKKVFKDFITIETIDDLRKFVESSETDDTGYLYRGVNDATYKNYASLYREWLMNQCSGDYHDYIQHCIDYVAQDDELCKLLCDVDMSNDLNVLAILQHYAVFSPLLDFSYDIQHALFFCADNATEKWNKDKEDLNNYVALYRCNSVDPFISCTIQNIQKDGLEQASNMVADHLSYYPEDKIDFNEYKRNLARCRYISIAKDQCSHQSNNLFYCSVAGPQAGSCQLSSKVMNIACEYCISNDRLRDQNGLFMLLFQERPFEELYNDFKKDKGIDCIHIHRSLLPELCKYLKSKKITKKTAYFSKYAKSKKVEQILSSLVSELKHEVGMQ